MFLECEIIPRKDSSPEQLKALGAAVRHWYRAGMISGFKPCYVDRRALEDLLRGELPQPWSVRLSAMFADGDHPDSRYGLTSNRIRGAFPDSADKQSIVVRLECAHPASRQALIESLSGNISKDLVEDILVAAKSWAALGEGAAG
jgi:hypothetical protein